MLIAVGIYLAIGAWIGLVVVAITFDWPLARWLRANVDEEDRLLIAEEISERGIWLDIAWTSVFWLPVLIFGRLQR